MDGTATNAGTLPADDAIFAALRQVIDPEVGVNIVDLGLIYGIDRPAVGLRLRMTMTSPGCPLGPMIVDEVRAALERLLPAATPLAIDLVWQPEWSPERMSERARRTLGWDSK